MVKKLVKAKKAKPVEVEEVEKTPIAPLEFADLSTLKDKLNEIIARINE